MDASEPSLSPEAAIFNGIYGDPKVQPRIGDEYQVKIPPLESQLNHCQTIKVPTDREVIDDATYSLAIGLPIPLMWIHDHVSDIKDDVLECHDHLDNSGFNELGKSNEEGSEEPTNGEHTVMGIQNSGEVQLRQTELCKLNRRADKGYLPVPGTAEKSWSDIEIESFVLSLYIFGKDLVQIKRFVESKEMGDILLYYYGKFYSSDRYRRWSECRKLRGRKPIHGQKIFSGSRQQELFSRLLPQVSDECQNTILQVSKSFGEGKISLEDYISKLKETVGMKALIEAVGVGKGKQDLTNITDPMKTTQVVPLRQEIPTGKECNSLASADIVKFLTGGRLSKARSNDLFWEVVWPRLLARGWHSEQPKNRSYAALKHSLVFLIPGVKKLSRRRHVKGNHYFDSVSDVLNKVALDPSLIEVETENDDKEEDQWGKEVKMDKDGSSDPQRHCYLQPKTSNCNSEVMKFTVVDTSSVEEEPRKIRELKTLHGGITMNTSTPSLSSESDDESSEEENKESKSMSLIDKNDTDTSKSSKDPLKKKLCPNASESFSIPVKKEILDDGLVIGDVARNDCRNNKSASVLNGKNPRIVKYTRKMKPCQLNHMAPVTKRRSLTSCANSETSIMKNRVVFSEFKEENSSCHRSSTEANVLELETYKDNVAIRNSAKRSSGGGSERSPSRHRLIIEHSDENAEPQNLIDLNLPHFQGDIGTSEPFNKGDRDSNEKGSSLPSQTNRQQDSQVIATSNSVASARRQSTRNRPLTTRALEALECGFFNVKRKRRGSEDVVRDNLTPKASRRAHVGSNATADLCGVVTDILNPKAHAVVDEGSSSNTNVVTGYPGSERNRKDELVGVPQPSLHPKILSTGKDR